MLRQVADPEKFKELYKELVICSRTKDKGCVQYDLLQSAKDPVRSVAKPLRRMLHRSLCMLPPPGTIDIFLAARWPQKQFRMIEAWETQESLDIHGGANGHPSTPWMAAKRAMQESAEFSKCGPASVNVDLTFVNVF
jgi:quinol monooxygenase YgiN